MNSSLVLDLDSIYNDSSFILEPNGSSLNEGFVSNHQKNQFITLLQSYPKIEIIYEVGLNAGHSAAILINNAKDFKKFVSFDINKHPYTPHAIAYFKKMLGSQFEFIEGNSLETIPEFSEKTDEKADLIYVDGCHRFDFAFLDILNLKKCAHENTILWIDDAWENQDVGNACEMLQHLNVIEIINYHHSKDPKDNERVFAEARYLF